jgi:hypothetical protein
MMADITVGIVTATIPFLTVAALLYVSEYLQRRERVRVTRQIAVTDAIHRELGATAAPVVERDWRGGWTVSVAVPFEQQGMVAAVARIAYEFFAKSYPLDVSRLRILLRPRRQKPRRLAEPSSVTRLGPGDVSRAA